MEADEVIRAKSAQLADRPELINASLHLLGVLFGLFAVPLLIQSALPQGRDSLFGVTVYGICFMMVFTFSSLYHSFTAQPLKRLFKKLDRISIYFLIAGTYTPFVKFYLFDHVGIVLLSVLWSLVVLGVLFEVYFPDRYGAISVMFYLFMGLIFLFVPYHFFAHMPERIVMLVLTGVLCYVSGVYFYVSHRWEYNHAIWHLFVLAGSICHYLAIWYTL